MNLKEPLAVQPGDKIVTTLKFGEFKDVEDYQFYQEALIRSAVIPA